MPHNLPITERAIAERAARREAGFKAIRRDLATLVHTVDDQLGIIPSDAFVSINRSLTRLIHEVSTWGTDSKNI